MHEDNWLHSINPEQMLAWATSPASVARSTPYQWKPSKRKLRLLAEVEYPVGLPNKALAVMRAAAIREIFGNPFRPILHDRPYRSLPLKTRREIGSAKGEGFGPTVQLMGVDPSYLSPTVRAIATSIYETLDFASLPILADAMEEAGCPDGDLLRHLRSQQRCPCEGRKRFVGDPSYWPTAPCAACGGEGWVKMKGQHVRGCFALDCILGKE